jgi:hypothetical protein
MTPGDPAKLRTSAPEPADEAPDVPGLSTWPAVYWFAFGTFVAVVVGLTIFSRVYA